ncbi:indole-3-glycerol phosphate synthase TrpC [Jeotgalibacillus sp. R-1-5s-1]|uniref:indole-3-glycerol phosphate synthase TrpC n=1 Tax=Jeotgalibacillus sp. R-1-5s-1 TaxID=2555897 RepID=UPI00106BC4F0|nr:indole-3-glycerol phosphate synthase TrpC [Jeotgalibacillus sp. R-1-5s-1]TFE03312.1 indole-3-glycerol phosphate synthase TrpC [Jeotgalibacillus sp. R-1-5s-1]
MTILDQIIEKKKEEVAALTDHDFTGVIKKPLPLTFLKGRHLGVIAEIKRASPSKGLINPDIDPVKQAKIYEQFGASAISVLTDEAFFKGSIEDLRAVSAAVSIPVLCKDFIIDERQILRAAEAGASIILLIVAALTDEHLSRLHAYAKSLNLNVLVEVHDEEELDRAIGAGAEFIGVNNRNLKTFEVDLGISERLGAIMKDQNVSFISESGIFTEEDARRAARAGANAVLVGESLMKAADTGSLLSSLQVPLNGDQT